MTEDRRKEIALMLVEQRILEGGIPGAREFRQDVGNQAKKLAGVTTDELVEFYQSFVSKLYGKIFGYEFVSIKASNGQAIRKMDHNPL